MKTLILATLLFVSAAGNGATDSNPIVEGSVAMTAIAGNYTVETVFPVHICPFEQNLCQIKSNLVVSYDLNGCLDTFAGYSKVIENDDGTVDVFITALNIHNSESIKIFCAAIPRHFQTIPLGSNYIAPEDVTVHFLGVE